MRRSVRDAWLAFWRPFWGFVKLVAALSFIISTWNISYYMISHSNFEKLAALDSQDSAALLFDAASLSLFVISIVIGLIGFPYIVSEVRRSAEDAVKANVQPLKDEMQGRIFSAIGYLKGEMSVNHEQFKALDREGLAEAIRGCEQGYGLLKKIKGPAEFAVLNNLVYYYCVSNDRSKSEFLVSSARRLLEAGSENNAINLQLTACRAILQFGKDQAERLKARDILIDIKIARESSEKEKQEAQRHLHAFRHLLDG